MVDECYPASLIYLFRVEPGANLTRASERIAGNPPVTVLQPIVAQLEHEGAIEPFEGGWAVRAQPDPNEILRDALRRVVEEPDPDVMTNIARTVLGE